MGVLHAWWLVFSSYINIGADTNLTFVNISISVWNWNETLVFIVTVNIQYMPKCFSTVLCQCRCNNCIHKNESEHYNRVHITEVVRLIHRQIMLSRFREVQKIKVKPVNLWEREKKKSKERGDSFCNWTHQQKGLLKWLWSCNTGHFFFSAFHRGYCMCCTVLENAIWFCSQAPLTRTVLPAYHLFSSLPIFLPFLYIHWI